MYAWKNMIRSKIIWHSTLALLKIKDELLVYGQGSFFSICSYIVSALICLKVNPFCILTLNITTQPIILIYQRLFCLYWRTYLQYVSI